MILEKDIVCACETLMLVFLLLYVCVAAKFRAAARSASPGLYSERFTSMPTLLILCSFSLAAPHSEMIIRNPTVDRHKGFADVVAIERDRPIV